MRRKTLEAEEYIEELRDQLDELQAKFDTQNIELSDAKSKLLKIEKLHELIPTENDPEGWCHYCDEYTSNCDVHWILRDSQDAPAREGNDE